MVNVALYGLISGLGWVDQWSGVVISGFGWISKWLGVIISDLVGSINGPSMDWIGHQ